MKRVKTGIKGFDKLVQGGFPEGSIVVLKGGPGVGKTIFAMQFLYNGGKEKERGLYISLEQPEASLKEQASQFGWKLEKGKVDILHVPTKLVGEKLITGLSTQIKRDKIKRLVIDSLPAVYINAPQFVDSKSGELYQVNSARFVYQFMEELKSLNVTTIVITEPPTDDGNYIPDPVSDYLADGVIAISFDSLGGQYSRSMIVRKMRQTNNDEDPHPVEIGKKGVTIHEIK